MYDLGKRPKLMTCPNCRGVGETFVALKCSKKTHLMALVFAPLLLCWIPYVTRRYRFAIHYCKNCHAYIGRSDLQLA